MQYGTICRLCVDVITGIQTLWALRGCGRLGEKRDFVSLVALSYPQLSLGLVLYEGHMEGPR